MLLIIFLGSMLLLLLIWLIIPHTMYLLEVIDYNKRNKEESLYDRDVTTTQMAITMIIGYIAIIGSFIFFIVWVTIEVNKPYVQTEEMQFKRTNIEYKLSYYDKLFYDYIEEAKEYNKEVNSGNNIGSRFKVEDRTEYMIDVDYYMTEFNNRTTTSTTTTD